MKINNIGYLLKEGIRGIFQHGFMSFAAVFVTVACLLIVGTFTAVTHNLSLMVSLMAFSELWEMSMVLRTVGWISS